MNAIAAAVPNHRQVGDPLYLRLQLDRQTPSLLPMASVQEVLTLPVGRVSAMPNVPACVLGAIVRRSRIFWAIDLAHLLGLPPLERQAQQYIIAHIQSGGDCLGAVVRGIQGVQRFPIDALHSPLKGMVDEHWVPFMRGCMSHEGEILPVFDPEAIAKSLAPNVPRSPRNISSLQA
ncbi:chemotaxis protein CheW [Synechococcus sp. PCC 7336]|uniref:chemotaxis protein CheW n=1 Tax=Synechococcus sp. PCC 7336 TaxID=195250 RepID=UPI0003461FFD|nr:chemotaxis protein CheW [Synechococcus sp. PCC 7336]